MASLVVLGIPQSSKRNPHDSCARRLIPLRGVARDLGVNGERLRLWVRDAQPASSVPLTDDERSELRRLRREVRTLRIERDILKKATAFFAKQHE